MRSDQQRQLGFSLIEVVVTLAVIGIIATFTLPAMRDLSIGPDAGELEPVRRLLVQAQQRSLQVREVELHLVPASGRYRILEHSTGGTEVREGVLALQGVRSRAPDDRFHVVFRSVGIGKGDTIAADGTVVSVDGTTGRILVTH